MGLFGVISAPLPPQSPEILTCPFCGETTTRCYDHPGHSKLILFDIIVKFKEGTKGTRECPVGYTLVTNASTCIHLASKWFGMKFGLKNCLGFGAVGCFTSAKNLHFSTCTDFMESGEGRRAVCEWTGQLNKYCYCPRSVILDHTQSLFLIHVDLFLWGGR